MSRGSRSPRGPSCSANTREVCRCAEWRSSMHHAWWMHVTADGGRITARFGCRHWEVQHPTHRPTCPRRCLYWHWGGSPVAGRQLDRRRCSVGRGGGAHRSLERCCQCTISSRRLAACSAGRSPTRRSRMSSGVPSARLWHQSARVRAPVAVVAFSPRSKWYCIRVPPW
jgi:hypothetical protein